jgi:hypothetical protein
MLNQKKISWKKRKKVPHPKGLSKFEKVELSNPALAQYTTFITSLTPILSHWTIHLRT